MPDKMRVFICLKRGEGHAQQHADQQPSFDILAGAAMHQLVVRPSHGAAGQQQDQRVDQRQVERVDGMICG